MAEPPQISLQPRLTVDGITINVPSLPEAVASIVSAAQRGDNFSVCTLNLDHVVQLQQHAELSRRLSPCPICHSRRFPHRGAEPSDGHTNRTDDRRRSRRADLRGSAERKASRSFCWARTISRSKMTARRLSKRFQGLQIAGMPGAGAGVRSLFQRSRCGDRMHSRLGRQALLRRAGRTAAGTVRGAVPRRAERHRRVMHRGRPRFHRRHAEPRTVHRAQDRAGMGVARAARAAAARAPLCQMHERGSAPCCANHSANCPGTHEESRMTSTLTLALRARNTSRIKPRYQICLIHPFDPRGQKVGGLETYIRDFITFHPVDTDILFIGVDSTGELELGQLHRLTFRGRGFDFLPILHYSDQQAREAARTIRTSLTGQFFMALLRHFGPIARLIRARRCSVDLRRVEFSWLPAILRLPFVQMLHGEARRNCRWIHCCGNTPSSTIPASGSPSP